MVATDNRTDSESAGRVSESRPQRRRLDFTNWEDALADIEHLHRVGYRCAGNWDLSQTLDHVGEGFRTAVGGTPHRAHWIIRRVFGPMIFRKILRQRRMKAGIKVPAWWLPGPSHDNSEALAQFRSDLSAFQNMAGTAHPHPFFGSLTKEQWNELALIHLAHHLSFLVPTSG